MNKITKDKILPFILTIVVIILDQITKFLIVQNIKPFSIGAQFFGDFLRIIHVSNTGVAFSMGANWGETAIHILFLVIPVIVI